MNDPWMFVTIFSGIWLLVGVVFFIIGAAMLHNRTKKELHCTMQAEGKVIDITRRRSHDSDGGYHTSLHPVFEYQIEGLTYVKESAYGSSQPRYAIGQTVEVYYNREDPHEFYIAGDRLPRRIGRIFAAVGVAAIAIAVTAAILVLRFYR